MQSEEALRNLINFKQWKDSLDENTYDKNRRCIISIETNLYKDIVDANDEDY